MFDRAASRGFRAATVRDAGTPSGPARGQHAELVALRVLEHDPGLVTGLPDVRVPGPEGQEAGDLRPLVVGAEIQVEAVLAVLGVRGAPEQKAGGAAQR